MGNETEQPGHSDETIKGESEKRNEKENEGSASIKQPVDVAAANRDERVAGIQPSPSPAIDFMGWSNSATPVPTTRIGNGGRMDSGGILRPSLPPFWYPGIQNLNQLPQIFQCPTLQTDLKHNVGPQYNGHGFVAIPFIPMFGFGSMPNPSNMFPVMMPLNMGVPMTMEGLAQSEVPRRIIPGTLERVPQGEAGDTHGLQGPPWGRAQGAQRPIERQRQANRRFLVGFQLDLLLLLKLAVVVFVFNQDGSKDRLFILLFLAAIVYMYQKGALVPLLHWFSQSAQRAMMPPHQQENANIPAQGQPLEGAAMGGAIGGGPEQNEGGNHAQQGLNHNMQLPPPPDAGNWWGLFKEMQILIVGFVTSLLPGYQHAEELKPLLKLNP